MHVGGRLILTGVDGSVMWAELRPDKDSERGRGSLCFFFCSSDTTLLTVKHFEMVKPGKSILEPSAI